MEIIDQNSALAAQEIALVPGSSLIDGRTEIDRLSFLTDFASVINFYDHKNKINGNWTPFLLKDPVILLASISKTRIDKINALYQNICNQIELVVATNKVSKDLVIGINHLFDQLSELFVRIERWTYYMHLTAVHYELKNYLHHQVKTTYSKYFWALLSLRENLSQLPYRYKVKPVKYYLYDNFDAVIWKQNKDKSPYWDILGLDHEINKDSTPVAIYTAIKKIGDQLLNFLTTIVSFAGEEYESVKAIKGNYPDTLLLRTFVSLLGNYNDQLNGLAAQHLQFYYQDILKQTLQAAVADQALIFADLAKPDATFKLPAGTLFNGGLDEQKNPILFETLTDVNLNPAKILNVYTLGKTAGDNILTAIEQVSNPTVIQKDEDGKVQSWPFFGNQTVVSTAQGGFMISSPLLFLREGIRTITVSFMGLELVSLAVVTLDLSTPDGWFTVDKTNIELVESNTITINLTASDPEIATFSKKPEKLDNSWPMLKIAFGSVDSLTRLIDSIYAIDIVVQVTGVKTLALFNDFGAISLKNPYQPFGPIPLLNSSFIIGSNEIFSKPITSFDITIDWNNLPHNFAVYYDIYNNYLNKKLIYPFITKRFKSWFGKKKTMIDLYWQPFSNRSFTAAFTLLQDGVWKKLNMAAKPEIITPTATTDAQTINVVQAEEPFLFTEVADLLQDTSSFLLMPNAVSDSDEIGDDAAPLAADPNIQQISPFRYTDKSTSGFMKIVLGGLEFGFGSGIYPNVVAQVAIYNAWMIANNKDMNMLSVSARVPFSPKISALTANYTAKARLDSTMVYPFQCYSYSPMASKAFSFKQLEQADLNTENTAVSEPIPPSTNDLLFSSKFGGFMFLEFDNLVPSESINLYFELTIEPIAPDQTQRKVSYHYLNEAGWSPLAIVADDTANFNCSGIVSIAIPQQITPQKFIGTAKKYWICIAADANSASFPAIVLLKTNGLMVQRYSGGASIHKLASNSITKTQTAVPQIATITQPFPSFGGEAGEDSLQMNQRISLRLKTKDRAVTNEDYFRLLRKKYHQIFYTKTIFNRSTKTNHVLVVPSYPNWQELNAFAPLANQEILNEITTFLAERTSGLINLKVTNFKLAPICVNATIQVGSGFTCEGVLKNVNHALNLFLSPWIEGNQPKMNIDEELKHGELTTFIQSIAGVAQVSNVYFNYIENEIASGKAKLIVSGMKHQLNCSY